MLTKTFKARKICAPAQLRSSSAAQAYAKLSARARSLNLQPFNVSGDGHCFFRALSVTLIDVLGNEAAKQLLVEDCTHGALRQFMCNWAEQHRDVVLDDEGEETLEQRAAAAALDWPRPVAAFDDQDHEIPVPARFEAVLSRMRDHEWADEFWVGTVAQAALGVQVCVISSEGENYDRLPQRLPEWVPSPASRQLCVIAVGHLVVNGDGYHYVAVRAPGSTAAAAYAAVAFQLESAFQQRLTAILEEQYSHATDKLPALSDQDDDPASYEPLPESNSLCTSRERCGSSFTAARRDPHLLHSLTLTYSTP